MKTPVHLTIAAVLAAGSVHQLSAAVSVVGPGTVYEDLGNFEGSARSEAEISGLVGLSLDLSDPEATSDWNLRAGGGLNLLGLGLTTSQGYTEIDGNTLTFGSNSGGTLGSIASAGLTYSWDARAPLNGAVTLAANQAYQVSFNASIDPSQVGVLEGISVEVYDTGSDVAIAGIDDADLASVLGLFGATGEGTVTFGFETPETLSGDLGIRFQGSQTADAGLLSGGDQPIYEFSSLSVAAVPEPGIGLTSLLGVTTLLLRKRRKPVA